MVCGPALALDRLGKESLRSSDVALGAQVDVHRLACPVDGAVEAPRLRGWQRLIPNRIQWRRKLRRLAARRHIKLTRPEIAFVYDSVDNAGRLTAPAIR